MNEFIEKNRRLLRIYCIAARIFGWVLVILSAMPVLSIPFISIAKPAFFHEFLLPEIPKMLNNLLGVLFGLLLLGVIVLGIAQLMRYVSESEYQPGWLLRHGTGVLYIFAVLMFAGSVIRHIFLLPAIKPVDIFSIEMHLLADVSKMLILIGLGNFLKRVIPVIEESKTLV
jgi:hypothetical protein